MHPLEKFNYCPVCGSNQFEENNFKSKRCRHCGFVYYANPCSATVAFIMRTVPATSPEGMPRRELLVARRAKEPAKNTLDIVGGVVDMEEYLFSLPNLYEYSGMTIHTLDMFFLVEVDGDARPKAADDVAELTWMPIETVDYRLFGLRSISQGVKRFVEACLAGQENCHHTKEESK